MTREECLSLVYRERRAPQHARQRDVAPHLPAVDSVSQLVARAVGAELAQRLRLREPRARASDTAAFAEECGQLRAHAQDGALVPGGTHQRCTSSLAAASGHTSGLLGRRCSTGHLLGDGTKHLGHAELLHAKEAPHGRVAEDRATA